MTWLNPCTNLDSVVGRLHTVSIGIRPRAYWRDVPGGGQILTENDSALTLVDNKLVARGPLTFAMFPALQPGRPLYGLAAGGGKIGLELLGVNARTGSNYLDGEGNVIGRQWANAWNNADLRVYWAHHRCEKEIGLRTGHPTQWDWKVWDRTGDLDDNLDLRVLGKRLLGARRPYLYNPADPEAAHIPVAIQKREIGGDLYLRMTLPPGDWDSWVLEPSWESQPGAAAGKDNSLDANSPNTNAGTATYWAVGSSTGIVRYQTVSYFDLSEIPASATIVSASLALYLYTTNLSGSVFFLSRILSGNAGWTEAGSCWNTQDGSASWAGSAGCNTSGQDYSATKLWGPADPGSILGTQTFALSASQFQPLLSANYGLLHGASFSNSVYRYYYSSDHATAAWRPMLTVEYTTGKKSNRLLMGVV